jgi:hypothetical protein
VLAAFAGKETVFAHGRSDPSSLSQNNLTSCGRLQMYLARDSCESRRLSPKS